MESCNRIKDMDMGGWYREKQKYERFKRGIVRIFILYPGIGYSQHVWL